MLDYLEQKTDSPHQTIIAICPTDSPEETDEDSGDEDILLVDNFSMAVAWPKPKPKLILRRRHRSTYPSNDNT